MCNIGLYITEIECYYYYTSYLKIYPKAFHGNIDFSFNNIIDGNSNYQIELNNTCPDGRMFYLLNTHNIKKSYVKYPVLVISPDIICLKELDAEENIISSKQNYKKENCYILYNEVDDIVKNENLFANVKENKFSS